MPDPEPDQMSQSTQPIAREIRVSSGSFRWIRRVAIAIAGFSVLLVGILMIVTPGPAFVVIPIGLGILGLEFAWARRWLDRLRERSRAAAETLRQSRPFRSRNAQGSGPP
jgi:uncharacterized protein (TIGR02611 family)